MASVNSLVERMNAEFSAAERRQDQLRARHVQEYQERRKRLEEFDRTLDSLRDICEPRLDAVSKKFGERVDIHPTVEPGRQSATLRFQSNLASITLRVSIAPDAEVRKIIFSCDLDITPILMKFDSHDQLELPLDAIDTAKVEQWLDERIVNFVHTYLALHENHNYLQDQMVEDPIAKVKFPKFAAATKLEQNNKTFYFIDESTRREFETRSNDP